ncbi:MAG: HAMP domain-containing sensor histidine kinase, partial [Dehalococcoidia bacterium]
RISPNSFLIIQAIAAGHLSLLLYYTGGSTSPFVVIVMFLVVAAAAYYRDNWPVAVVLLLATGVVLSPFLYETLEIGTLMVQFSVTAITMVTARWMFKTMARTSQHALQLSQTRSAFLLALTHQLRTPLASLQLSIGVAKEEAGHDGNEGHAAAAMAIAEKSIQQMSQTLDEISELFRIASEGTVLDLAPVNAADEIQCLHTEYQPEIQQRSIQFSMRQPEHPVTVWADAKFLRIALSNLIKNALEHTPEGGSVSVVIEADATNAEITIEDSGSGIDKDFHNQLFLPYATGNYARLPDQRLFKGGLGLGLLAVKTIIESHGGKIQAKEGRLGGTAMVLTLERVPVDQQARPSSA